MPSLMQSRIRIFSICRRLSSTSVLKSTSREYCKAKNTSVNDHVKNMISKNMRVCTLIFGFEPITKSLFGENSVSISAYFFAQSRNIHIYCAIYHAHICAPHSVEDF